MADRSPLENLSGLDSYLRRRKKSRPAPAAAVAAPSAATGRRFGRLRAGGLWVLRLLIQATRRLAPAPGAVFPAWQGMQYLRDMFDGRAQLTPLDNTRYPDLRWTGIRGFLADAHR